MNFFKLYFSNTNLRDFPNIVKVGRNGKNMTVRKPYLDLKI